MDIHNLMEDVVLDTVNELFDAKVQGDSAAWCTCRQCRMDVACFVLNRLKPEYVLSGRGVAYSEIDYGEKLQRGADVASLVKDVPVGPVFNVRPIMGRLFNGSTFEPIIDANISLVDETGLVKMMDSNWPNPYPLAKNTNGTFTFWPFPVTSARIGESRRFSFTIVASPEGYEDLSHFEELEEVSDPAPICQFSLQTVHRLRDLYVFPK
jgi:competence protein ComFB